MTVLDVKKNFHSLIDSIEDKELLSSFYEIIKLKKEMRKGELWNDLSEEERKAVLISEEESKYESNLVPNSEVKKQNL